jgi:hypothetical protein
LSCGAPLLRDTPGPTPFPPPGSAQEPDTRSGAKPVALKGTLTATGLTKGAVYDVYRWDTVGEAFTYQDEFKRTSFTAAGATHVYADDKTFQSDGTTYYRVLRAA